MPFLQYSSDVYPGFFIAKENVYSSAQNYNLFNGNTTYGSLPVVRVDTYMEDPAHPIPYHGLDGFSEPMGRYASAIMHYWMAPLRSWRHVL